MSKQTQAMEHIMHRHRNRQILRGARKVVTAHVGVAGVWPRRWRAERRHHIGVAIK